MDSSAGSTSDGLRLRAEEFAQKQLAPYMQMRQRWWVFVWVCLFLHAGRGCKPVWTMTAHGENEWHILLVRSSAQVPWARDDPLCLSS